MIFGTWGYRVIYRGMPTSIDDPSQRHEQDMFTWQNVLKISLKLNITVHRDSTIMLYTINTIVY